MLKNERHTQVFLNQLNWKTNTGELARIDQFQVDIYKFVFKTPLVYDVMTEFTEYIQGLSMARLAAVMKIWVWLYQHGVRFRLVFGYNRRLPFVYNAKNILGPWKVNRQLRNCGHDDLMSCPLGLIEEKQKERDETERGVQQAAEGYH